MKVTQVSKSSSSKDFDSINYPVGTAFVQYNILYIVLYWHSDSFCIALDLEKNKVKDISITPQMSFKKATLEEVKYSVDP